MLRDLLQRALCSMGLHAYPVDAGIGCPEVDEPCTACGYCQHAEPVVAVVSAPPVDLATVAILAEAERRRRRGGFIGTRDVA